MAISLRAKSKPSPQVSTTILTDGKNKVDPFAHLPNHEASILRRQIKTSDFAQVTWRALFRFASPRDILIIVLSSVCAIAAGAVVPLNTVILGSLAGAFQDFTNGQSRAEFDARVKRQTLYFVYLAVGEFATIYFATVGFKYTGEDITRRIREQYLKAVLRQNAAYFDKLGPGTITNRISADTNVIQEGISDKVGLALSSLSTFIAAYIVGFIKYWKLTLALTSMTPVLFAAFHVLTKLIVKYSKQSSAAYGESSTLVEEAVSSIRTVTAFGTQERLAIEYNKFLARAESFGLRMKCIAGSGPGVTICIFNLGYALASWLGSKYIVSGEANLPAVLTILLVMMLGSFALGKAAQHVQAFANAIAAAGDLYATIDRAAPWDENIDEEKTLKAFEGRIEFRDVKHIYPSRPDVIVLQNLNLVVPAGSTIAITGASGSGKSTIIALIERYYDPVAGEVLIDGERLDSLNLRWLRQQIGLVSQEPCLFSGTVEENIRHGLRCEGSQQATESRPLVEQAARLANAHDFIMQLPHGYDTHIGERGSLLSGGQRQRVAVARAVVGDPKILLFDEATSALDSKSESVVQAALENAARGRTTIIIAHRLSTIQKADNIVVMGAGGSILEQGTYEELSVSNSAFRDLLEAQKTEQVQIRYDDRMSGEEAVSTPGMMKDSLSTEFIELQNLSTSTLQTLRAPEGYPDLEHPSKTGRKQGLQPVRQYIMSDSVRRDNAPMREDAVQDNQAAKVDAAAGASPKDQSHQTLADNSLRSLIKFSASLNRQEWKVMLLGVVSSIISGAGEPVQCVILAHSISTLALPPSQYRKLRSDANFWSGMFVMIAVVMLASYLVLGVTFAYGSERLVHRSRDRAFRSILRQDIQFFDRAENTVGALTSFLSTETTHLAGMSGLALGTILQLLATLVIGYIVALAVGWKLALVCIATVPVLLLAGFLSFWSLSRFEAYLKDAYRESASYACEAASSTRTIAAFTMEHAVWQRYHKMLVAQGRRSLIFNLKSGVLYAASQSLGFLCMALAFWYGSQLIGDYSLNQFYLVFFTVIFGTRSAANMFSLAPNMAKAKVAAAELKTLFERTPAIDVWSSEGDIIRDLRGSVEFRDVVFQYKSGQPVLSGLNLTALPGQYVALVGASGCGKSTTISLLERFYDPSSGGVFVDGQDISTLNLAAYRKHLSVVSQEQTLYQGTIRDNILISVDNEETISEAELVEVCNEAAIHDFIASLPAGYDTIVGSKGTMLSGGQKQRIALARSLIRNPKILLLDEATSALDSESESIVQAALDSAAKGRTTIAVAHRLSTIRNADVIYVMDEGRVVESGTHAVLMGQRGRYFEMLQLQSLEREEGG